ncbi:MAG: hypothetical protein ACK502_05280 [Alphaproteobacteria bacterium]
MVSPKTDMPEPRKRAAGITAQIQAARDKILPNPSDNLRLAEGTYLALRLSMRPDHAKTDENVQLAEMGYRGALREALKEKSIANTDRVVESVVTGFFDEIERIVMNAQLISPRSSSYRRATDHGPPRH